jgi:hypothetical protein
MLRKIKIKYFLNNKKHTRLASRFQADANKGRVFFSPIKIYEVHKYYKEFGAT